jgi:hypothetical protein
MIMTVVRAASKSALKVSVGLHLLAFLALIPAFAGCASAASSEDTFILPPPADHDGPNVTAQPVPAVEVRPIEGSAVMPGPVGRSDLGDPAEPIQQPAPVAQVDPEPVAVLPPTEEMVARDVPPPHVLVTQVQAAPTPNRVGPEHALWHRALVSDNPELTKIYLLRYPDGRHVAEAKVRFRDLLFDLGERRRLEWRQRQG